MNDEPKYIYFDKTESIAESFYKDFALGSVLTFCIYISNGSTFWTFITGIMFLILLLTKIKSILKNQVPFKTKKELLEFVNKLPDDKENNN